MSLQRWIDRLFVQTTWGIGAASGTIDQLLTSGPIAGVQFISASSARYRYLADPFPVQIFPDGTLVLLCEQFDLWNENRGTLRSVAIKDGKVLSNVPAIRLPGHASFPFLVRDAGRLYCIPETGDAGQIQLFRAEELPLKWHRQAVLVDNFPAADPTAFQFANRWWLAATSRDDDEYRNLYMWYADALPGPWQPHARNPVKSDIRSARPAGTPFVHSGHLYRPAQDCSDGYGRRVIINRIDILTSDEFQETPVATIEPDPASAFPDGLHTVNVIDGLIVIDGRRDFFDPLKQVKKQILARGVRLFKKITGLA